MIAIQINIISSIIHIQVDEDYNYTCVLISIFTKLAIQLLQFKQIIKAVSYILHTFIFINVFKKYSYMVFIRGEKQFKSWLN